MKNLGSQQPVSTVIHVDTRIRPISGVLSISGALREIKQRKITKQNEQNYLSSTLPHNNGNRLASSKTYQVSLSQFDSRPSSHQNLKINSRPQSTIPNLNFTIHQLISRPGSGILLRELSSNSRRSKKPNSSHNSLRENTNIAKSAKINEYIGSYNRPMSKMKETRLQSAIQSEKQFLKRRIKELDADLHSLAQTLYIQDATPEQLLAITSQYCMRFREYHEQHNNYTQWVQNLLNSNQEQQTQLQKSYDQAFMEYHTHNDQINTLVLEISFLQTQLNQYTQASNIQYLTQIQEQIIKRETHLQQLRNQVKGIDDYRQQLHQVLADIEDIKHQKEQVLEAGNVQRAKFESQLSLLRSLCETQENDFEDMKRSELNKKEQNYQKQSIQSRKDFIQQYSELERKCTLHQNKLEWQKSKLSQLTSKLEELQLNFQIESAEGQRMRLLMLSNYVKMGIKELSSIGESLIRKINIIDNVLDDVIENGQQLEGKQLNFLLHLSELGQSGTYSDHPLHLDDFFH